MKLQLCSVLAPVCCLSILAGVVPLPAQDCADYEQHFHPTSRLATPGSAQYVASRDDLAFIACGAGGLVVADLTDMHHPTILSHYDTPGFAYGVAVQGDYCYLADGLSGFKVLDVSNPHAPNLLGTLSIINATATSVTLFGGYAFVCWGGYGIAVVDISDPSSPIIVGAVDTINARRIAVTDSVAYVAEWDAGLAIVDIRDLTAPVVSQWIELPGCCAGHIAVSDSILMVGSSLGTSLFNVSHPFMPELRYVFPTSGGTFYNCMAIEGSIAYLSSTPSYHEYAVVELSNASSPIYLAQMSFGGVPSTYMLKSGDKVLITAEAMGLLLFGGSNVQTVSPISQISAYHNRGAMAALGDYLYTVSGLAWDEDEILNIYDVSELSAPYHLSAMPVPVDRRAVDCSYPLLCIAGQEPGLMVLNVSDPMMPSLLYSGGDYAAEDIALYGSHACIAAGYRGLLIIDLAVPAMPTIMRELSMPGVAWSVCVSGPYAYVGMGTAGLCVVDVADPTNAGIIGHLASGTYVRRMHVEDDYLYVAGSGMHVIDISTPSSPYLASTVNWPIGVIQYIVGNNNYLYAFGNQGYYVMDRSDALQPRAIGCRLSQYAQLYVDVAISERALIVYTDWGMNNDGLVIMPQQCGLGPGPWQFAIADIPNDQGGMLQYTFTGHHYDAYGAEPQIVSYDLQRFSGSWATVVEIDAVCAAVYEGEVSTEAIYVVGQAEPWEEYRVVARTSGGAGSYVSATRRVYSIDNIPPPTPTLVVYDGEDYRILSWSNPEIPDFPLCQRG